MYSKRTNLGPGVLRNLPVRPALACVLALAAAGCSTDVTRFDFPLLSNGESAGETARPAARQINTASADTGSRERFALGAGRDYQPPPPLAADNTVSVSSLPETPASRSPSYAPAQYRPAAGPSSPEPRALPHRAAPAPMPAASPGKTIEVAQGDTLYRLARANGVTVQALMSANGLQNAMIKPGQRLVVPAPGAVTAMPPSKRESIKTAVQARRPAAAPSASTPLESAGDYKVQTGDSLYVIARRHGMKVDELAQLNGISDPTKIRVGQVLKLRGDAPASKTAAAAPAPAEEKPTRVAAVSNPQTVTDAKPVLPAVAPAAQASNQVASAEPAAAAAETPASSAGGQFRWPAQGKIIAGFGPRKDGPHNDGINIAVPLGASVHAAEDGTVAYAGNELKGYGNLILVRHSDNWVSAYAHNDKMLVKRGDTIKRGQVIAKAGKSGNVETPQIHFELRRDSKPVDPIQHLAKN